MRLKALAAVLWLFKSYWVFNRRRCLVRNHETLKMGHTGIPETLVYNQTLRQVKKPKNFYTIYLSMFQL